MANLRLEFLERVSRCFDDGEIETLVPSGTGSGIASGAMSTAVRVRHLPTGEEVTCEKHPSQILNKSEALLDLLSILFRNHAAKGG